MKSAAIVGVLLLALALQAGLPLGSLSASCDEVTHLPSGYTYLKTGQVRLNPQHPPLMKELCALPLLLLRPALNLDDPGWTQNPPDEWGFGSRFLYSNDADRLLLWGRLVVLALSLLLGVYVYLWARDLHGNGAGLLALFLYAFCPNIIAHSRLVTMDLGLSCFLVIALYHLWRFGKAGGRPHLILAGLALGLALATKFSAVILLPTFAILLAIQALAPGTGVPAPAPVPAAGKRKREPEPRGTVSSPFLAPDRASRLKLSAGAFLVMLAIAMLVVYVTYLSPRDPFVYWKGMMQVNRDHATGWAFYFWGDFKQGGWLVYFLGCLLLKTPVPTLVLFCLALFSYRLSPPAIPRDHLYVAVPAVLFLVFTSLLADNLGVRYVLPLYPLAMILTGRIALFFPRSRLLAAASLLLAAWLVVDLARIYPDHLAYFNTLVGGPSNGHKYLDDSNIDWGTDLKRLKQYQDSHGTGKIRLLYDWTASPGY